MTNPAPSRPIRLDPEQAAAVAHRGPLLRVLGAPGTGKTRVAVELLADRVAAGELDAGRALLLAATRRSAASLREQVTTRLGATTREPLARTFPSLGFGILRRVAIRDDLPTPRLLSGPEQDVVLRELLAGHRLDPGLGPAWPEHLQEALTTRGFVAELRDLLMRAVEHGLGAGDLADLGVRHDRADWVAAAEVLQEYDEVTALSRPGAYDPAWILAAAADALADDPDLLAEIAASIGLVVVDDAQEITAPAARLLAILAGARIDIVLLGDPDTAVQTFRGADPTFLASTYAAQLGSDGGTTIVLRTGHRVPADIAAALAPVPRLIGALGGGRQRAPRPARDGGQAQVHLFRSAAQEAAYVADVLRRAHLLDGVPWQDMAVIVRGQGRSGTIRRVLSAAQVPVAEQAADLPVRDEPAVRPLLTILQAALDRLAARRAAPAELLVEDPDGGWRLTPESAIDLLTSPYGGADAVILRRLRRALRRRALDAGAGAPPDDLLAAALAQPGLLLDLGPEASGARRIARMLAAVTAAADGEKPPTVAVPGAAGPAAEALLWSAWESAGVASEWRELALGGRRAGVRADRDLDAVLGLFGAAADFADRLPGIGARAFLEHVGAQEVAADSILPRSQTLDSVSVLTPHAAAGGQWGLVAVVGVQEGAWPDLRLRGSLLGSELLVDLLRGREPSIRSAQAAVRHDEARLFHVAVTRASRRLIVTATRTEDEQPSPYLDVLDPLPGGQPRGFTEIDHPLTLVGVVGALRRELSTSVTAPAAMTLATLAAEGVRGADPDSWWALRELTDDRPRIGPEEEVRVSPSALVAFGECQLRWLLGRVGGEGPSIGAAAIGTLVHEVLADLGDVPSDQLTSALGERWGRLGLPPGWISRSKRADADSMVQQAARYIDLATGQGWSRVGSELALDVLLGRARIAGSVDRLERDATGALRVIDYKTGSSKPKTDEVARHPQLGAYQLAVSAGAFGTDTVSAGAALVQLGKASTKNIAGSVQAQPPLTEDEDPAWVAELVTDAAESMAAATVTATVGDWCRTCAVRASCPVVPEGVRL